MLAPSQVVDMRKGQLGALTIFVCSDVARVGDAVLPFDGAWAAQ